MKSFLNVKQQILLFQYMGIHGLYSQSRKTLNNQICSFNLLALEGF